MFEKYPVTDKPGRDRLIRVSITFVRAIISFLAYNRYGFAVNVSHEPVILGSFGGDALAFMDLLIYVLLIYVVLFESLGLGKKSPEEIN
ncbi:hypothetical protein [Sporomusa sp. KB1]|jgi:hypothetical protein|uniref:hypothetical protein n=1 Tax=Sporomusa sp. KB1 TaxID=943346 RepID=UPI001C96B175|nr:hypothetical protein [Sporomusa sp. KB1]